MWTNITTASRNLSQLVGILSSSFYTAEIIALKFWIHVPSQREGRTELQGIIEKKTMIRLVSEFVQ